MLYQKMRKPFYLTIHRRAFGSRTLPSCIKVDERRGDGREKWKESVVKERRDSMARGQEKYKYHPVKILRISTGNNKK